MKPQSSDASFLGMTKRRDSNNSSQAVGVKYKRVLKTLAAKEDLTEKDFEKMHRTTKESLLQNHYQMISPLFCFLINSKMINEKQWLLDAPGL